MSIYIHLLKYIKFTFKSLPFRYVISSDVFLRFYNNSRCLIVEFIKQLQTNMKRKYALKGQ